MESPVQSHIVPVQVSTNAPRLQFYGFVAIHDSFRKPSFGAVICSSTEKCLQTESRGKIIII